MSNDAGTEIQPQSTPTESAGSGEAGSQGLDSGSTGLAPDSSSSSAAFDLSKAEKIIWEGREMTTEELRRNMLRQQDYTKKTQEIAERRRQFDEERRAALQQQEQEKQFDENIDADIDNVLKNPSLEAKFKEIYPAKYHRFLDRAMNLAFGDRNTEKGSNSLLEQRLNAIERQNQAMMVERQQRAFETEVQASAEILESNIARLSSKYPMADEESVLARAEYMAAELKKDDTFNDKFSQIMEKLYKENHDYHEKRYQQTYKQKVESQKQANSRARDVGKGGATPGTAPAKIKLKDVKNHILGNMG